MSSKAVGAGIEDYIDGEELVEEESSANYLQEMVDAVAEAHKSNLSTVVTKTWHFAIIQAEQAITDALAIEREDAIQFLRDTPQMADSMLANSDTDPRQAYALGRKDGFIAARLALEGRARSDAAQAEPDNSDYTRPERDRLFAEAAQIKPLVNARFKYQDKIELICNPDDERVRVGAQGTVLEAFEVKGVSVYAVKFDAPDSREYYSVEVRDDQCKRAGEQSKV